MKPLNRHILRIIILVPVCVYCGEQLRPAQFPDTNTSLFIVLSSSTCCTTAGSVSSTPSPSVTSSSATSMTTSTCSNGITGIESSNGLACCAVGCGQCGGVGCSTVGLPEYDADDCCSTEIVDFGMSCSVTGSAPCYVNGERALIMNFSRGRRQSYISSILRFIL